MLCRNARMNDFLDAISQTGQPKLTAAFTTFLNQPGVPEINVDLKCNGTAAASVAISHASIVLPFVLGGVIAVVFYARLAPPNVSLTPFMLFMGVVPWGYGPAPVKRTGRSGTGQQ